MKRFILYLVRWQLSTPILWLAVKNLGVGITSTIIANLIGGAIFFWIDKFIFTSPKIEMWQIKEAGICDKCGKAAQVWRLVRAPNYDRTKAKAVFLCSHCSKQKIKELKARGVKASQEYYNI